MALLRAREGSITEHDLTHLSTREINAIILENTNGASQMVPAIRVLERYVGGYGELMVLDCAGDYHKLPGCER